MKKFFVFTFLIVSIINVFCQDTLKEIIVSSGSSIIYPLTSDKNIEKCKEAGENCYFIYPLLILNNVIIREEEKVNYFRNYFEFVNIKNTKRMSKEDAEKKGISNVPEDGVLFVTTKKDYIFDFPCE